MQYPFKSKYKLGTRFGTKGKYWKSGYHSGLDLLSANYGGDGKVYPIYAGVVTNIGTNPNSSYGNYIIVTHPDGYCSLYAHLDRISVVRSQSVAEGTVLGIEGSTGNVTGKHLHLEIHKYSYKYPSSIDPLKFINERMVEVNEVQKSIKLNLNGKIKTVEAIECEGHNYVKLQDLRDDKIIIDYDSKNAIPIVQVSE